MFATEALSKPHRSNRAAPPYNQIRTPVAASAAREVIWFQHPLLLGDEDLLVDVAAAVGSLRRPKGQVSMASTKFAPAATE
jgi:hypothetical protein